MKKTILLFSILAALTSCDKFLDVMPDNRAEVDTIEKVQALLTSAYLTHGYPFISEYSSDNVECTSEDNPYTSRFLDQVYAWKDVTENANESPESVWEGLYSAIAAANQALEAIEKIGGATDDKSKAAKAEALICRAYGHFMLVNLFCLNYNSSTSGTDPGIPYVTKPETTLNPGYDRGTVAEVYRKIDSDLQEALPYIRDTYYKVPKYHFNLKAAYAFAARFYLYYEDWDNAIMYADKVLGTSPKTMLRDYKALGSMTQSYDAVSQEYVNANCNCNLLMTTDYSYMGAAFGPYFSMKKYSCTPYLASNESIGAKHPWGSVSYYSEVKLYSATNMTCAIFWRLPYQFEYTDAVAQIGYIRTTYPMFTADECLLNRAEARVMKQEYAKAAEDINTWLSAIAKTYTPITPEGVTSFYSGVDYSSDMESTVKKHLHPAFSIGEEGGIQECMIQAVLNARRIETYQTGLRWFDVKRYGIEIIRRTLNASGTPDKVTDRLLKDDPRRAMQIPKKVVDAGIEANKR